VEHGSAREDLLFGRNFAAYREISENLQQSQVFRFGLASLIFTVVSLRIRELFAPALMQAPRSAVWKFNFYQISISANLVAMNAIM